MIDREKMQSLTERRGHSAKDVASKIETFGRFQGNVVRAYTKRLKAAARREDNKKADRLAGLMDKLVDLMGDIRSEARKI